MMVAKALMLTGKAIVVLLVGTLLFLGTIIGCAYVYGWMVG